MVNTEERIISEIKELKKVCKQAEKNVSQAPEGRVHIKRAGRYYSLYNYCGEIKESRRSLKYVRKKSPAYKKLLNAEYCRRLIPVLEREIGALEDFSQRYEPQRKYGVLNSIPEPIRSEIDPLVIAPQERCRLWAEEDFDSNQFFFDDSAGFINEKGERFRSKAEYIIASVLTGLGLYYRYECEYEVCGRHYFPDFTVMHPQTCELYYIEYFGLMADADYAAGAIRKIAAYQSGPDAARFIYIFEANDTLMNVDRIRNMLTAYFLQEHLLPQPV